MNKVRLYWNSHKKLWSVLVARKVVQHLKRAYLEGVKFVILNGGRAKCLRDGVKCVHAFAEGVMVEPPSLSLAGFEWVVYRPSLGFVMASNGLRVECAAACHLTEVGACWVS